MEERRVRSKFEPGMIFTLDHLKKDDLHFDIEAEIARYRTRKGFKGQKIKTARKGSKPKTVHFDRKL